MHSLSISVGIAESSPDPLEEIILLPASIISPDTKALVWETLPTAHYLVEPLRPGLVWRREDARGASILPTDGGQILLPHEPKGSYVGRIQNPNNWSQDPQHPEEWVCVTDLL